MAAESASVITKDAKKDAFGHIMLGGIGEFLCTEIEKRTGAECRYSIAFRDFLLRQSPNLKADLKKNTRALYLSPTGDSLLKRAVSGVSG